MLELPFGGWLAKNVYFLGRAGAVWFGGVRFAGISGIYKPHDYHRGLWERPPCRNNHSGLRSAYHVRSFDVFRLKQLRERVDVGLSHDWPSGVVFHGDRQDLYRRKKHLKADAESNCLGNPPARELLDQLKPNRWLSGHLHVQFKAIVEHDDKVTHFYGMDKPGTKRPFLEVFDIPRDTTRPMRFERDSEWLSILRVSHPYTPLTSSTASLPANGDAEEILFEMDKLRNDTERKLISNGGSAIPEYDEYSPRHDKLITNLFGTNNPQTVHMHTLLGMQQLSYGMTQTANSATESANPEELNIGDYAVSTNVDNPEEVDID
jgi:lariat debranching enzyme